MTTDFESRLERIHRATLHIRQSINILHEIADSVERHAADYMNGDKMLSEGDITTLAFYKQDLQKILETIDT